MSERQKFSFVTVTSKNYVAHTAGLYCNIRDYYSDTYLVVCCLDQHSFDALSCIKDSCLKVVLAKDVWGEEYWHNICCRMRTDQKAFATKSALSAWALQNVAESLILLDADLLFLDRIDDMIEKAMHGEVLLSPTWHEMGVWHKSNNSGIFSAGFIGFSVRALKGVNAWKAYCFNECSISIIKGYYFEQKFLQWFLGDFDCEIISDPGINTTKFLKSESDNCHKKWTCPKGEDIRVFHMSRTICRDLPISKLKEEYNAKGLRRLNEKTVLKKAENTNVASKKKTIFQKVADLDKMLHGLGSFLLFVQTVKRVIVSDHGTLKDRIGETFFRKASLVEKLNAEDVKA